MVTQPGREPLIRKALACFRQQTYEHRELVVVHDAPRQSSDQADSFERFLQTEMKSVRIVSIEPGRSLGELRNLAIESAKGELVCQWDDDDQYHPNRLARQWEAMFDAKADACFLASQLHYFARSRELFVRDTGRRGIEGTVMHRRDLPVRYPAMGKEEDTVFMHELVKRFSTTVLHGDPWLYLRVFHGSNTWDEGHHRRMMRSAWDVGLLRTWKEEITRQMVSYDVERPVTIRGRDGRAFGMPRVES
jgi:glycosyltransferase involved in cell wall biosynthesis